MKSKTLGKTGLTVSQLGLGGLFVSSYGAAFEESRNAVMRALQLGVNYVDTAPGYFDSEQVLGAALQSAAPELAAQAGAVVLSTKLGGRPQPFLPQDRACLMQSVEESLRLLHRDSLDLLLIHEPERPGQYDWWSDPEGVDGPVLELLTELKRDGVVKAFGLAGTTVYEMARLMRSGKFDVVLTAYNYSLLWREAEHVVIDLAHELGMGVIVGSPLQQGALAVRRDDEVNNGAPWMAPARRAQFKELYEFLDETGLPLAEVAIRFAISNPAVSCVLMGARSAVEVESNVGAVEKGPLLADQLKRLDEIAAICPMRPYEEPMNLPFGRPYYGPGGGR